MITREDAAGNRLVSVRLLDRPLRADALRNRQRILLAAKEAFAEEGSEVQMEAIARRAGIGVGTLYRNFATKQALLSELAREHLSQRVQEVEVALTGADPIEACRQLILQWAQAMAANMGRCELMSRMSEQLCPLEQRSLRKSLAVLIDRMVDTGRARADLTVDDFRTLMYGLSAAIAAGGDWQRCGELIFAGLLTPPAP